jgi:hypothetical protein
MNSNCQPVPTCVKPVIPPCPPPVKPVEVCSKPIGISAPWPSLIIAMLSAAAIIYTAVASGIDSDRRVFGIAFILLWAALWAIILWVLWYAAQQQTAWYLLLFSTALGLLFFLLIIVFNVGNSV